MTKTEQPKNWKTVRLEKLVKIDQSSLGSKTDPDYQFKYVSLSDVDKGVISSELSNVMFKDAPSRARRIVKKGDILFSTVRPNLEGYARINLDVKDLIASTGFAVLSPKELSDTEFIYQYLYSYHIKKQIYALVVGSNYPAVNSSDVAHLKFNIPNNADERKAIADLLSTWDSAIEKTERLIAAKEKRFQWLLDELISKPSREGKWKEVRLSKLFESMTEKNSVGETNVLTTSAEHGLVSQNKYYKKSVSAEDVSGYYLLKQGDFAYNRSSSNGYPYGVIKRLDESEQGVLSTLYLCMRPVPDAKMNSDFYVHLFESGILNKKLRGICQEGARSHGLLNLSKSDYFGMKIPCPEVGIQNSVAEVLNLAEKEIEILKATLEKQKEQKRGLMQKLLTSEWRVKPEIVNQYMEV